MGRKLKTAGKKKKMGWLKKGWKAYQKSRASRAKKIALARRKHPKLARIGDVASGVIMGVGVAKLVQEASIPKAKLKPTG